MNTENLHELINRYEQNYDFINNTEHEEIFKWKAVKHFRDIWFSEDKTFSTFAEKFNAAMKESSIMINNSMISPTTGVVKLAEIYPVEVERLFRETLFSGESNPEIVQDQMDRFIEEMEKLRQKGFPRYYRYKQDRHAASCYLAFFNPSEHFVYRYTDAEAFAKYIEFGKDLGSGENFSLPNYYEMAQLVVEALKQHTTLLEKHRKLIEDSQEYYEDNSLHLMAFDLMYSSRCYNFYSGLTHISKKESIKNYTLSQLREKEHQEKLAQIQKIKDAIYKIKIELEQYEEISLLDVEVTHKQYGIGKIIAQEKNKVKVQFSTCLKSFVISNKYKMRPTFENDTETVEAFTRYADLLEEKERLEKVLQNIQ